MCFTDYHQTLSSCLECRNGFSGARSPCVWCVDPSVPWINADQGGGRCMRADNRSLCTSTTFDSTSQGFCPRAVSLSAPPEHGSSVDVLAWQQQSFTMVLIALLVGLVVRAPLGVRACLTPVAAVLRAVRCLQTGLSARGLANMLRGRRVAFIGAGQMGEAMIAGMLRKSMIEVQGLLACAPNPKR